MEQHSPNIIVIVGPVDQFTGRCLTKRERIIAAERNLVGPYKLDQIIELRRRMNERIEIHTAQISPRAVRIIHGAEVGPDVKAVLDAADRRRERPAAVGEENTKLRKPLECSRKDQ